MEKCCYLKNEICAYDLKDRHGYYRNDLVEAWKIVAAERKLFCCDCGAGVYLAAGSIKEPYFAHYDKEDCEYSSTTESEEMKKGKRLLYHLLRRSFPDAQIQVRYRLKNNTYAAFYVKTIENKEIIIDYRLQNNSIEQFLLRDQFYKREGLLPLYVLGSKLDKQQKQLNWYQNLIQKSTGFCTFLDTAKEGIRLKKGFDLTVGKKRFVRCCQRFYALEDVLLNEDAKFHCDFLEYLQLIEDEIEEAKQEEIRVRLTKEHMEKEWVKQQKEAAPNTIDWENIPVGIRADVLQAAILYIKNNQSELVSKKYLEFLENKIF